MVMHLKQQQRFINLLKISAKSKTCQKSTKGMKNSLKKKRTREINKQEKRLPKLKNNIKYKHC